ncbi:hypothetical protein B0A67_03430 [Flavobacterium aquidurense]|uniref:MauE/DoxX family redox-associated membrane protein n=1 Tax=Flavobacterium aquidurense TaxID=362413 RepID=UPI00091385E5|nr:MauE/DoxX family redox-associated membrane protein [Flavobacterium aquidurense]OXA73736.1 hypothetical protein B0A67_03430 [Flavobacterium aquidurense]SHG79245.1 Uncharacterized membrane protein YphA, DoxX/SURF4 family [Flavobacterium frigidimaris]
MKLNTKIKNIILDIICLLYVLLFVYAAVSKLLDFENFEVQLGKSPLLSAFASWISWLVPAIELAIVLLLIIPKFRSAGLLAAFSLMTMFTAYIFIVLHYSSFIPCSCGGILEKMSWNAHLVFNIIFVLLAGLAIVIKNTFNKTNKNTTRKYLTIKQIMISIIGSIAIVVILFLSSEDIMHNENPFIRRYPQHPVVFSNATDLKLNSYYFAGYRNNRIYLGNYTNPLHVISMDTNLGNQQVIKISFDPKNIPFKMATVVIRDSNFYLMDGSVPTIFRGSTSDWKITKELKGIPYFTLAVPLDSTTISFRSNNAKKLANVLGVFTSNPTAKITYNRDLLQQQIDGIFDTDGTLLYSEEQRKIVYLYYYRNEFIVADKSGTLNYRGHTIDTIKHANIKVSYLRNGTQAEMSSPPFVVNAHAAICQKLLFVHSKVKGKYENDKLWQKSFIIDVYDLNKNAYILSFPIYRTGDAALNSIFVTATHLYAIIGNDLVVHELKAILTKEMKTN